MSDSFPTLIRKLGDGDGEAASAVFRQYAGRLIGLSRRHLDSKVQSKVDQDDVVQSVFRTFFRRAKVGEFTLGDDDALWALLAEIAVRKCGKWNRHFNTVKRSTRREQAPADYPVEAPEPTAAEAAELADLVETLLSKLDDRQRLMCELRMDGRSIAEIALKAGVAPATVFRELNAIQSALQSLLAEAPAETP